MKKWLILTTLTALLLGACSTENEVSEQDSDKQTALVQKEDKNKSEKSDKEKKEKAEKEKLEIEKKEKEKKAEEAKKAEDAKKAEEAKKAEDAEKAVQTLEANQVTENVAPAQAAISNVADQGIKDSLTYRVGLVQNAINIRAQQAAEAEQARQAAEAEQARQAQQQAFASQPQQGAYRNCREARAAGAAPLYRGQPGYGSHLDRDGDGVACE
jgi:probable lipoprotein